jgi:hypothetical protein
MLQKSMPWLKKTKRLPARGPAAFLSSVFGRYYSLPAGMLKILSLRPSYGALISRGFK